jgi:hypothetical protein
VSYNHPLKVYKAIAVAGFEWLLPVVSEDSRKLRFDGTPCAASWVPVSVARLRVWEDGRPLEPGDFPSGCGFVVSRAAKDLLGPDMENAGELLALNCPDGEFWTLNVTRLVDALDEDKSKVLRSSETNRILMVNQHYFHADRLGPEIFKLSQTPRGLIYFTESFVDRVKSTSLKGFDFKLVWAAN